MAKFKGHGLLRGLALVLVCAMTARGQITPQYFNIAENRLVTVNATCGEGLAQREVYCKLVGNNDDMVQMRGRFDILDGQICDYCYSVSANASSEKTHPIQNVVDGDTGTWWQSPPISRGLKYNKVTMDIDLQQLFQVAYVVVTMANSPRPGVWSLERSTDHGQTWEPWQYFAGNDAECQQFFGIRANERIVSDDQVICDTEFSQVLPIEDGEVFVPLLKGRPSAKDLFSNDILQNWITATNIRLRLIQTKTMLGHLMSVAQGDRTVTRRYYYSIKEISVGGRCVCNGHAYVCPPLASNPDLLQCQCLHNTDGINCDMCADGFTQKKWRQYTNDDKYECEPCNCHGHTDRCYYDPDVDLEGKSMDIYGNYEGGGVCQECGHFTAGINCETCTDGFFRPVGVLPNATEPCIPCQCYSDEYDRYTGNCEPESGKCECREAFRGADDCSACADGYYDYPNCKPCDCFANGTVLQDNGVPFCVAEGSTEVQCPCKYNYDGAFCNECAEGFYNFPDCIPCDCERTGSLNDICNRDTEGQCQCDVNYGSRRCDECRDGYYDYPDCESCSCDPQGTEPEICDKRNGACLCKEGFDGLECDRCSAGWYDYPNCKQCECSTVGSDSSVCDPVDGRCPCFSNFGGRQCLECSNGYYQYPECKPCNCDYSGSRGSSCDDNGICLCNNNFVGAKCDQCAPQRYNYPLCEECNCDPEGVTQDFFALGGCDSVPAGSLCTCKERVTGRICDSCKPLFWNLQGYNTLGCEDCQCHRPGTIGAVGVCDQEDGQCACKPNVGESSRICDVCNDGFFGLKAYNGLGCDACQCDVGGTELARGESAVCDKDDGQCRCRNGMAGRKCDEIMDGYYVPTLHQFQYEIEDGYRTDNSTVRIGNNDANFPGYSWRGYGAFSQLQDEVRQDIAIVNPSVYRVILRVNNPNDAQVVGEVTLTPQGQASQGGGEMPQGQGRQRPIAHRVLIPPTQGQGQFVTVKGEKDIYPQPFDLEPGRWTVGVNIPTEDPESSDVLVDYFVLLPNEYYEPSLLKEDVLNPCVAGEILPYCRDYVYPDISRFPTASSADDSVSRPGGEPGDIIAWGERPEILDELGSDKMAQLAPWQPEVEYRVPVINTGPGQKHVLAVVFFTPETVNDTRALDINARAEGEAEGQARPGKAYVFNCPYSSLCRQVVTDDEGRVAEYEFGNSPAVVKVALPSGDQGQDGLKMGVDSIVAIPLEDFSLDLVNPEAQCVKRDGICIPFMYPSAPDGSVILPFVGPNAGRPADYLPAKIHDPTQRNLIYLDPERPITDITGAVPRPGYYVLVANYFNPDQPEFEIPMNISYANPQQPLDVEDLMANGQFHEAVLPLPTCQSGTGCRSVIKNPKDNTREFMIPELFNIQSQNIEGKPAWLESVIAIPTENYRDDFVEPGKVDKSPQFADECSQDSFYTDPNSDGFCRNSVISLAADFNRGALDCRCDREGTEDDGANTCAKLGGQCQCKPNVMGRQCSRCKPGFFGFPNCQECKCPKTARCDETTGDCICAKNVAGTPENPCSTCAPNTFGYDAITGCQDCGCQPLGTVNGNMSCSLENGNCFCAENVEGRTCDRCSAGSYQYPECNQCTCDLRGTTQDICDQTTSACLCKRGVEGRDCDLCQTGKFNLEESNPDGCTDCFCFGKTEYCKSHEGLKRTTISDMDNWGLTSFAIGKTLVESPLVDEVSVPNYSGELALAFDDILVNNGLDLETASLYFKAPDAYLRNRINSYGGHLRYSVQYSGYDLEDSPKHPDVILVGGGISLLFHGNRILTPNEIVEREVPLDPYYWVLPSGATIDRIKLMVVLNNLEAVLIRANYGLDRNGQIRLNDVSLDSAEEVVDPALLPVAESEAVTSVEQCTCPPGYHGYSCEDCAIGFFRESEGPFGPFCAPCQCNNHADFCHPLTGECVVLKPQTDDEGNIPEGVDPEKIVEFCHFRPDLCETDNDVEPCQDNTTGSQCQNCTVGYFGYAEGGTPNDCNPCPCPLAENNFAISCDALLRPQVSADQEYCICQENYMGERCQFCGPGYFGLPETLGDFCKPCTCNGNIDVTDYDGCDRFSGICMNCLNNTYGDSCERCAPWYFGDAVNAKNCEECYCDRQGTQECEHTSGRCECLPGVEGEKCDRCQVDHWGFAFGEAGCEPCECTEAAVTTQCDLQTGQCRCKPGVVGQKCDQCQAGFWNLGPYGCESCGCNTEFAVGGTCDQETGQCECLEGVIGQNCDHCPDNWVLVVNETRTVVPEWKRPFNYREGCFPCSSCVADLMGTTNSLNSTLAPVMVEFLGVESSVFAYQRLNYIEKDVNRLAPEISLLNPQEGSRRLEPLESQANDQHQLAKSLNVDYKLQLMDEIREDAKSQDEKAAKAVMEMDMVGNEISRVTSDMREIADGLGSGVSPEQLEQSVNIGNEWLADIKSRDFSPERQRSFERQNAASEMVNSVEAFTKPVEEFNNNVTGVEGTIIDLRDKLEDLKNNSLAAQEMVRDASGMNFRNSEPPANFKTARITAMTEATEANNAMGSDLVNEAEGFLEEASASFGDLGNMNGNMDQYNDDFDATIRDNQASIDGNNREKAYEVGNHVYDLERQANEMDGILANAKAPGGRTLEAAMAYESILDAVDVAQQSAEEGSQAADSAASMSVGVREKADAAATRTNVLYEDSTKAEEDVRNEIGPAMITASRRIEAARRKNKETKTAVASIDGGLDGLSDVSQVLKETVDVATDAHTVSYDALASIQTRADEVNSDMKRAKTLQEDHASLQLSIDAIRKSLSDIESRRRQRRQAAGGDGEEADVNRRLVDLKEKELVIDAMRSKVNGLLGKLKTKLSDVKEKLGDMDVGMTFGPGSNLELNVPETIEELGIFTRIALFFNVSKDAKGDGRAFILYVGNTDGTHTRMPHTTTDDYIAVEVLENGLIRTTIDLGTQATEIISNRPILYDQWNHLEIERTGHRFSMKVKSEAGPGEVEVDAVEEALPRYDDNNKPFGSVFNLHPEYSRIFVGGFPTASGVQTAVRETDMVGQIEGLTIGGKAVGLWNYKAAALIRGAPGRNKFRTKPKTGVRFSGNGHLALDRNNFNEIDGDNELSIGVRFKPESEEGLLFAVGSEADKNFVALDLQAGFLVFSFDLGDGPVVVRSDSVLEMNEWHNAQISRKGKTGSLTLNSRLMGTAETYQAMTELSVEGPIFIGGWPGQLPFDSLSRSGFVGCVDEVIIGPDAANLEDNVAAVAVTQGCQVKPQTLATFSSANPGYVQLQDQDLFGRFEIRVMFKTGRGRGLLFYAADTPNAMFYISLSLLDGALDLRVFPDYELSTSAAKRGAKPGSGVRYDDDEWHTVTVEISQKQIAMHVDDYDYISATVDDPSKSPDLDVRYNVFLGSIPDGMNVIDGMIAANTPYVGCVRDVMDLEQNLIDFNKVLYFTGPEFGVCKTEKAVDPAGIEDVSGSSEKDDDKEVKENEREGDSDGDGGEANGGGDSGWELEDFGVPEQPEPDVYGECKLPVTPARDMDVSRSSGLRFGTQYDTYLEFKGRPKMKKWSKFRIDFRTTEENGIIFYAADNRHMDFMALFVKQGRIYFGFNCGSGGVHLDTGSERFDDGAWHTVRFERSGVNGKLYVDGDLKAEGRSYGDTGNIEVKPLFFLGGVAMDFKENAMTNLKNVNSGFVGCLRNFRNRGKIIGKWSKNNKNGVIPCSEKVEPGYFIGPGGGFIRGFTKFRVGLDFDITMSIKPRNISGLLLSIQGRRDYVLLEMKDGTMTFTVDNGRGAISAVFKPSSEFQFCDGNWHSIHAVKAKNVVTLSVDEIFAKPGIGVPGVSSTDTNHPLRIGGHPKPENVRGLTTDGRFVGCIKDIVIEDKPLIVTQNMLRGNVMAHVCPTI